LAAKAIHLVCLSTISTAERCPEKGEVAIACRLGKLLLQAEAPSCSKLWISLILASPLNSLNVHVNSHLFRINLLVTLARWRSRACDLKILQMSL